MGWLLRAMDSSVGRKLVMGATGLFLCFFITVHLAGNFLLFVGAASYDHYAHTLHSQPELLLLAELGLYSALAAHIYLAIRLTQDNRAARKRNYRVASEHRDDRVVAPWLAPEKWMLISGLVVLIFSVVHVADFKFGIGWGSEFDTLTPYEQAELILSNWLRRGLYLAGCIILGFHAAHGFQSAWQSLGVNHPKINGFLKGASVAFGIAVAVGFSSFPVLHGVWSGDEPTAESRALTEAQEH